MAEKKYGMVIDTSVCVGCQTCKVSCKISNEVPGSALWNHLESLDGEEIYVATGAYPAVKVAYRPMLCNHCENPACVAQCPTGAMTKDEVTGIVASDPEVCIGCQTCVAACPYAAPSLDEIDSVITKCNFCINRVEEGALPYCVESCPANARIFGDLNDESSEVAVLVAAGAEPYLADAGTEPNVYYITA